MKYNPSYHAIERARQRFGIAEEHAKNWYNQLMENAIYVSTQPDGKVMYKHAGKDTIIVVDDTKKVIVTILTPHNEYVQQTQEVSKTFTQSLDNNAIISKARDVIKRELSKFRRQFTKETRLLTIEHAELNVEIAQLTLNKARAKSPITQDFIQAKIFALQGRAAAINERLTELSDEYEQVRKQAETFI